MKGILFKPWKINAIAYSSPDTEWQTRRIMKPQPVRLTGASESFWRDNPHIEPTDGWYWQEKKNSRWYAWDNYSGKFDPMISRHARYQVGEIVYIKEAWAPYEFAFCTQESKPNYFHEGYHWHPVTHRLGKENYAWGLSGEPKWHSPLFMPESAARYFIRITDVRAERVQEITGLDCLREGCPFQITQNDPAKEIYDSELAIEWYRNLWDSINKPPYDWDSNPSDWVYSFKKVEDIKP